jgi:hypothetical protein
VVLIPKRAVIEHNGAPAVWVVNGATASRRAIALGAERINDVEIRSGVVPGDAVIIDPPPSLADGGRVKVK